MAGGVDCGARMWSKRCPECRRLCMFERHDVCPGCGHGPILYWCVAAVQSLEERCPLHVGQPHWQDLAEDPVLHVAERIQSTPARACTARLLAMSRAPNEAAEHATFAVLVQLTQQIDDGAPPERIVQTAATLSRAALASAQTRAIMREAAADGAAAGGVQTIEIVTGDPRETPDRKGVMVIDGSDLH